jgi:hypothetical protein
LMILAFLSFWLIKRRRRARAVEDKSDDDAERRMLESAPEADKAGKRYHYNSFRPSFQAGLYKAQPPTQPPAETPPPPPPKPEETQTMTDAEYTSKYQWSLRRASQISRKSFADLEHGYSNLSGRQRPSLEEAQLADVSVDISRRSSMTFATPPSKRSSLVGVAWGAQAHSHLASGDSTAPGSIHSDTTRQSGAESVDVVYAPKTTGLPASE